MPIRSATKPKQIKQEPSPGPTVSEVSAGIVERVMKSLREKPTLVASLGAATSILLANPAILPIALMASGIIGRRSFKPPSGQPFNAGSDRRAVVKVIGDLEHEIKRAIEEDRHIIDFVKWRARVNAKATTSLGISDKLKQEFTERLHERGLDALTAALASEALGQLLAEYHDGMEALPAIRELREQYAQDRLPAWQRLEGKPRYSLRQSGLDPIAFLETHYLEELRAGSVGPGQIQAYDRNLYTSLWRHLNKAPGEGRLSMAELFASYADEGRDGSSLQRRIQACATILGTNEVEAARFLASVRPDRVRQNDEPHR